MHKFEGPKSDVRQVKLSDDARERLLKYLEKQHASVINQRDSMKPKWKAWVDQLNSRLKRKDGGSRDSNLDMTLTRERAFQSGARLLTPIFQQDKIMVAPPRKSGPESRALSIAVENLLDYILDRAEMMPLSDDWSEQFHTLPYGVVKTPFVHEVRREHAWAEATVDEFEASQDGSVIRREIGDATKYYKPKEVVTTVRSGAFPEVIPAEDFLFADASDPETAAWVTHRVWLTKSDLKFRIKNGLFDSKTPDGQDILSVIGEPVSSRQPMLSIDENKEDDTSDATKKYEVMETYLAFDVEGKGDEDEIIVWWDRHSKIILRCVYNFYHTYKRPFVVHQYKHVNGSMYGIPLTFYLEPLHRAYSASINQRLDAASKANEVMVLVPPEHPLLRQLDRGSIRGGVYENPGWSKDDIIQFKISDSGFSQLPQLESVFEQRADRVSHLSPMSFGEQEVDRPTATSSTIAREEGATPQYLQLERFRSSFALVVKHMLARYRQFYPEGLVYYVQQNGELQQGVFTWPERALEDEVIIETKVSSATMSKAMRKQEIVSLMDKMPMLYQTLFQMASAAANPQNPTAMMAAEMANGMHVMIDAMLREFEVGEREQLNPDLMKGIDVAQNFTNTIQQLQQALQQAQGAVQQAQMEGAQKDQALQILQSQLVGEPVQSQGMAEPTGFPNA